MLRTLTRRGGKATAALIAAAALGGSVLAAVPAGAAAGSPVPAPVKPYGTITALTGVNERAHPSIDSTSRGVSRHRTQLALRCKVRAQDINGNNIWYQLRDRETWVTARYVEANGEIPRCRSLNRSAMDQSVESRHAMG
ncbi:SH3 domain-containing protein [Streptomyces sp. NPDC052396]|uniref:SH3 domain-containing protein n=1 Tax=Streptomyces sp. NPDC052396 TaxID=3365689 RepID=UPI0037D87C64